MPKSPTKKRMGSPSNTSSLHKKAKDATKATPEDAAPAIAKENSNVSNKSPKAKAKIDPEQAKAELREALRVGAAKAKDYHEHMNAFTSDKINTLANNMDASHQRIVKAMANVPQIADEHKAAIENTLKEHKAATDHARSTAAKLGQHSLVLKAQEHGKVAHEHMKKLVNDPNLTKSKSMDNASATKSPKSSAAKSPGNSFTNIVDLFRGDLDLDWELETEQSNYDTDEECYIVREQKVLDFALSTSRTNSDSQPEPDISPIGGWQPDFELSPNHANNLMKEHTKIPNRQEVAVQDSIMTESRFSQFSMNSNISNMQNPNAKQIKGVKHQVANIQAGKGKSRAGAPSAKAQGKGNGVQKSKGIQMNIRKKYEAKDNQGRYFEFMPKKALPNNMLQGSIIQNNGVTLSNVVVKRADVRLSGGLSGAQLLARPAPTPQQKVKPTAKDIRASVTSKGAKGKSKGKGPQAQGGKARGKGKSISKVTQPENYRYLDNMIIHQRQTYEAQFNKNFGFHECVIRGPSKGGYRCTIYLDNGITLNNVQINKLDIKPYGRKALGASTDWQPQALPSKLKPVKEAHDMQELQIDWTTGGLPKCIKGTDWTGHYNTKWPSFKSQRDGRSLPGQELMCDWSVPSLPQSMSTGARQGNWAKGSLEQYGKDAELLTIDWAYDGIPAPRSNTKHTARYNQMYTRRQPEMEIDWSVDAIPYRLDGAAQVFSHIWTALHRSMYSKNDKEAAEDKMRLVMDWSIDGMPIEAIGQPWTLHIGGIPGQRSRMARKIEKRNRSRMHPLARFRQLNNYKLDGMKGAIQTNMDMDHELNRTMNRKNQGEQLQFKSHPEKMKTIHNENLRSAHKNWKQKGTNKSKKAYKLEAYRGRIRDMTRKVEHLREWKKMKQLQAREGRWQLRAGLRYNEMDDSNVFFRKADQGFNATSVHGGETHFVFEQRNSYEAMDASGKWWDCVVKSNMGDGNYIIAVPMADGTTFKNLKCHRNNIRPHLFHNIKGMYEAVDDDGVFWDVVINGHLKNGDLNIHVVANSGAEYPELKTHWGKVRLKLHFNTPHLYQAIDRQGYAWSIVLTRDLGNELYAFDCYSGNEKIMENLRVHRDDIRLDGSHMYLSHMTHNDLKESGLMPKQASQRSFKHEVLKQKMKPLRAPATPPMPTHAPPRAPVQRKGTKRKLEDYEEDAANDPPMKQQETFQTWGWLLAHGTEHTVQPMTRKTKIKMPKQNSKMWGVQLPLLSAALTDHQKALIKGQKRKGARPAKSLGDVTWTNYMPAPKAAPVAQKKMPKTKKGKAKPTQLPAQAMQAKPYNWNDKQDVSPSYKLPQSPAAQNAYADDTWLNVLDTPTTTAKSTPKASANASIKKKSATNNPGSPTRRSIKGSNWADIHKSAGHKSKVLGAPKPKQF